MSNFKIPEWFYHPINESTRVSTAAGCFNPSKAIQDGSAWECSIAQSKVKLKKKLLLSDWSLEQDSTDLDALRLFIMQLLDEEFELYMPIGDKVELLTKDNLLQKFNEISFSKIPNILPKDCREIMNSQLKISADDLVILDYVGIKAVAAEDGNTSLSKEKLKIRSRKRVKDNLESMCRYDDGSINLDFKSFEILCSADISTLDKNFRDKIKKVDIDDDWYNLHNFNLGKLLDIFPNINEFNGVNSKTLGCLLSTDLDLTSLTKIETSSPCSLQQVTDLFEKAPNLQKSTLKLKLNDAQINFDDLKNLLKVAPNLDEITLSECINIEGLSIANSLQTLKKINFSLDNKKKIDAKSFENVLKAMPNLEEIRFPPCDNIEELQLTKNSLQALKKINFSSSQKIDVKFLGALLKAAPNLQEINSSLNVDLRALELTENSLKSLTKITFDYKAKMDAKSLGILLRAAPNLQEINFPQDVDLAALELAENSLQSLTKADLFLFEKIDAKSLGAFLRAAPNLQEINFPINVDLAALELTENSLQSLTKADLSLFEKIDAKSLGALLLKAAPNLQEINFPQSVDLATLELTENSLQSLTKINFDSLGEIDIEFLSILLKAAPNLHNIDLGGLYRTLSLEKSSDSCLGSLRTIDLSYSKIDNQSLAKLLKAAPNLHNINFNGCENITDLTGLSAGCLQSLTTIYLNSSGINGQSLAKLLKAAPNLHNISFGGCENIADLTELSAGCLQSLTTIYLNSSKINGQGLVELLKAAPNLHHINLSRSQNILDLTELSAGCLQSLTTIDLQNSGINSQSLVELLKAAPNLHNINLSNCKNITNLKGLPADCLESLTSINLKDSSINSDSFINSDSLASLLKLAPNLVSIDISSCKGLDLSRIPNNALQNLTYIKIDDCCADQNAYDALITELRRIAPNIYEIQGIISREYGVSSYFPAQSEQRGIATSNVEKMKQSFLDSDVAFKDTEYNVETGKIEAISANARLFKEAREYVHLISTAENETEIKTPEIKATTFKTTDITPEKVDIDDKLELTGVSKDDHHVYKATQKFNLKENTKYKLSSLTPYDQLLAFKYKTNTEPKPCIEIHYCTDDNFYYISTNSDCTIETAIALGVKKFPPQHSPEVKLGEILQHCKNFHTPATKEEDESYKLQGITDQSSGKEKLQAMYTQQKGACRHRVGAFLDQVERTKEEKKISSEVKVRGVLGPTHNWVEISKDGGLNWYTEDLGGHPAKVVEHKVDAATNNFITKAETKKEIDEEQLSPLVEQTEQIEQQPTKPQEKPKKQHAPPFAAKQDKLDYKDINHFRENLFSQQNQGKRILLSTKNPQVLEKLRNYLVWSSKIDNGSEKDRSSFALDNHADFLSSKPRVTLSDSDSTTWKITKPPSSEVKDFLESEIQDKTLFVDWSQLTAEQMVQVNSMIDDKNRNIDSVSIPENCKVIGLISSTSGPNDSDFLEDPSFTSRHDQIIDFPFNENELDAALEQIDKKLQQEVSTEGKVLIDLFDSPNWRNILFGRCIINSDQKVWHESNFIKAFKQGKPIEIKNPPLNDPVFVRTIGDMQITGSLLCYGQKIKAPEIKMVPITYSSGYNFDNYATDVKTVTKEVFSDSVSNSFVVNSDIFERCFVNEIVQDEKLISTPGWIELNKEINKENKLSLFITDDLNIQQWSYLLDESKKHKAKLNLKLAPGVVLPKPLEIALKDKVEIVLSDDNKNDTVNNDRALYKVCDDISYALAEEKTKHKSPLLIDATELSDEDVLYRNAFDYKDEKFEFQEKISEIWDKLQNPDNTIIIHGKINKNLISHLSSLFVSDGYLWHQGEKKKFNGKLILITDEDTPSCRFIAASQREELHDTTVEKKKDKITSEFPGLNLSELFKEDKEYNDENLFLCPYSKILQVVKYAVAYNNKLNQPITLKQALQCCYSTPNVEETEPLDLSENRFNQFENEREKSVDFMLSWSPYVLLEGPAGAGKSSFIRDYTISGKNRSLFTDEKIEDWARNQDNTTKILFIDEANLLDTDWTKFTGLFNNPPTIFLNGENVTLTDKHKVVFAGNPLSYGGGRKVQSLFANHPATLKFPSMPAAYIHHKILLPILSQQYKETHAEEISRNIFKQYNLSHLTEPEKHGITVRDLQFHALKYCSIKKNSRPESTFQQDSSFFLADSRRKPEHMLNELFMVRKFKLESETKKLESETEKLESETEKKEVPDAVKYGGKNAFLLDGSPGVGKSEFMNYMLRQQGLTKAISDLESSDDDSSYYHIPASCNNTLKLDLLKKAFDNGKVVVMDEINSCVFAEPYLNAYLMGEHINKERPKKNGFMLIGTSNAASLRGRRQLSPAVLSRAVSCHLDEYNKNELMEILKQKTGDVNVPDNFINLMISEFLKQKVAADKDDKLLMPTFRDLLRCFDNHLEKCKGHLTGSSYEDHEKLFFLGEKINNLSKEEISSIFNSTIARDNIQSTDAKSDSSVSSKMSNFNGSEPKECVTNEPSPSLPPPPRLLTFSDQNSTQKSQTENTVEVHGKLTDKLWSEHVGKSKEIINKHNKSDNPKAEAEAWILKENKTNKIIFTLKNNNQNTKSKITVKRTPNKVRIVGTGLTESKESQKLKFIEKIVEQAILISASTNIKKCKVSKCKSPEIALEIQKKLKEKNITANFTGEAKIKVDKHQDKPDTFKL